MADSPFAARLKALAYQAGLNISEVSSGSAQLVFTFDEAGKRTRQTVWGSTL